MATVAFPTATKPPPSSTPEQQQAAQDRAGGQLVGSRWGQQLVLEVVQQLSRMFKPDFKLIKKRIEDLIARDYLERDKDNPQLFKYLA